MAMASKARLSMQLPGAANGGSVSIYAGIGFLDSCLVLPLVDRDEGLVRAPDKLGLRPDQAVVRALL